jgi:protein-disulfide isomerase
MNRRSLLLGSGAAVVAVGGYGAWSVLGGSETAPGLTLIEPAAAQTATDAPLDLSRVEEMVLGNPDSPVEVIEFASYTCPHCASFHAGAFQQLKREYIDTGLIRFVYREVYFDAYGLWAALVARCGGPMRYFGISSMLYEEQATWSRGADGAAVADNLRRIGRRAGMSDDEMNTCLADRDLAMAMMQVYQNGVQEYGVRGTPSFVINGRLYSNMSFAEFQAILDPLLGR